jgi:hypothetical protein
LLVDVDPVAPELVELCPELDAGAGAAAAVEAGALGALSPPLEGAFFSAAEVSFPDSEPPSEAGALLLLA